MEPSEGWGKGMGKGEGALIPWDTLEGDANVRAG